MTINYGKLVKETKKRITERDKKNAKLTLLSTGEDMYLPTKPEEFVVGPAWWQEMTGILGLPYGFIVQVAGRTDSGKTSCVIEYMRKAQEQDVVCILVDTEKKTTKKRLTQWGVDPEKVFLIRPNYLEEMYQSIEDSIETIQDVYPDKKIILILDSLGNTVSKAEAEKGFEEGQQMGVRASINNKGFSRLVPKLEDKIAFLFINQTYDNMGSPGKTNKGGTTKEFAVALTFQTTRMGWIEGQVKGEKVRKGARVKWNLYKHHLIDNDVMLGKQFILDITAKGVALKGEAPEEFQAIEDGELKIDEETGEISE